MSPELYIFPLQLAETDYSISYVTARLFASFGWLFASCQAISSHAFADQYVCLILKGKFFVDLQDSLSAYLCPFQYFVLRTLASFAFLDSQLCLPIRNFCRICLIFLSLA